jgi:hypothetical protein
MRRVLGSVACGSGVAMALGLGSSALAAPITYTVSTSAVSGMLGASAISLGDTVTVTLVCDTSNVNPYGPPPPGSPFGHYNVASVGSATVQVNGGTTYTFANAITIWGTVYSGTGQGLRWAEGNANTGTNGFSFNPGSGYPGSLTALTTDYASGVQTGFSASPSMQSSAWALVGGGTFYLDGISSSSPVAGSFSSVTSAAVPGAGLAAIGGVGLAGLTRRRRG